MHGLTHSLTIHRTMPLSAATLFRAWTHQWGAWFAEPGSVHMTAEVLSLIHISEPTRPY